LKGYEKVRGYDLGGYRHIKGMSINDVLLRGPKPPKVYPLVRLIIKLRQSLHLELAGKFLNAGDPVRCELVNREITYWDDFIEEARVRGMLRRDLPVLVRSCASCLVVSLDERT
jgi:hypothetical protein